MKFISFRLIYRHYRRPPAHSRRFQIIPCALTFIASIEIRPTRSLPTIANGVLYFNHLLPDVLNATKARKKKNEPTYPPTVFVYLSSCIRLGKELRWLGCVKKSKTFFANAKRYSARRWSRHGRLPASCFVNISKFNVIR